MYRAKPQRPNEKNDERCATVRRLEEQKRLLEYELEWALAIDVEKLIERPMIFYGIMQQFRITLDRVREMER